MTIPEIQNKPTSHEQKVRRVQEKKTVLQQPDFYNRHSVLIQKSSPREGGPVVVVGLKASHVGPRAALLLHDGATVERLAQ